MNPEDTGAAIERPEHYDDDQWEAYKQGAADFAQMLAVTTNEMANRMAAQTDGLGDVSGDDERDPDECPDCGGTLRFEMGDDEGTCPDCGATAEYGG